MSYSYSYSYQSQSPVPLILGLVVAVFLIICQWKIFVKAGKPGWAAIVPIYNAYVLFEVLYGKGVKFLLMLVPLLNIVIGIAAAIRLAHVFGKSTGFGILNLFFSIICTPIIAFGDAEYQGPIDSFL